MILFRNRPEIRLNPVPAGFPASNSGSGSCPVSNRFAGFQPEYDEIFLIRKLGILTCLKLEKLKFSPEKV